MRATKYLASLAIFLAFMYANEQIGFSSGSDEYTVELAYLFTAIMYPRYIPCIFCVAGFHSGLWLVKLLDDYERA